MAAATQLSPNRLLSWPAAASLAPLTGALLAASAALTLAALWATASAVALLQHATLVTMLRFTPTPPLPYSRYLIYLQRWIHIC